jgi:hypothetical protein
MIGKSILVVCLGLIATAPLFAENNKVLGFGTPRTYRKDGPRPAASQPGEMRIR